MAIIKNQQWSNSGPSYPEFQGPGGWDMVTTNEGMLSRKWWLPFPNECITAWCSRIVNSHEYYWFTILDKSTTTIMYRVWVNGSYVTKGREVSTWIFSLGL